jgi:hypothetical protein
MYHQDPFDRIIVAQAITERAHLYTVDRKLAPYSELVRLFTPRAPLQVAARRHSKLSGK